MRARRPHLWERFGAELDGLPIILRRFRRNLTFAAESAGANSTLASGSYGWTS